MRKSFAVLVFLFLVSVVAGNACGDTIQIQYVLTDLGALPGGGGNSRARGINDSGQIVGSTVASDGVPHAFLYSSGTMQDLGLLPGYTMGVLPTPSTTAESSWAVLGTAPIRFRHSSTAVER